ncbi:hypothetical protein J2S13_002331 [Oikeobacillus pervagus]|uniref:Uncharacterized protein n=1 Tax=Oikeobacillus pervagus TaxID=1325931 RepID=A0AAJ1WL79_9BACI|nr:HTH domain-containing protein [Oikeobacillus pervagus]MDQ0215911.1 hypothetical protein [Oikeobacillus pervagus]
MSKITFSTKDINILQKNPNIQRVSERSITYTDDFKNRFIDEYQTGKFPRQIFEENGFNVEIIGIKRIEQSAYRWKKAVAVFRTSDRAIFIQQTRFFY